jgi:hypothetical protein
MVFFLCAREVRLGGRTIDSAIVESEFRDGVCDMKLDRVGTDATAIVALLAASVLAPLGAAADPCTGKGVELQVLGSGGPELEDKRASSSYLLWQDGRARVLVDSGGGSALRFGQSGAHVEQLDAILFTHLHIDHSADFAALIKSSYFEQRDRELPVYGPTGNTELPSTRQFVAALFDRNRGAYRYLGDFLSGQDDGYKLQVHNVPLREH